MRDKTRVYGAGALDAAGADDPAGPETVVDAPGEFAPAVTNVEAGMRIQRYEIADVLGRGGMGEILSAHDAEIGRLVAIKRLRVADPSPEVVARFLREARIQGRLEHPAVVPVHELWHEPGGRPFFVMKQLAGLTLGEVLAALAAGDAAIAERFPLSRLLRAFADICLALEFAHTRGVVHRDLKPANITLGEFGEVYVLDWGIAKVAGASEADRASFARIETVGGSVDEGATGDGDTGAGAILGTPGYIPPEQIRGDRDLDGRADVYALGCILFEILALQPLHPRGQAALATALVGQDARASVRAPERAIPPELDAICGRATALDRAARYPTARQLSDAVQHFLDGNRDFALRKQLAAAELAAAQAALAAGDGPVHRRDAMRAAARALALDPSDRAPADLVGALMLEAPRETPPEVDRELEQLETASLKFSARFGVLASVAYLGFFALLYWVGFRETWYVVSGPVIAIALIFVSLVVSPRHPYLATYVATVGNIAVFLMFAFMVSPVVLGAGPAILMITLLVGFRRVLPAWILTAVTVLATVAPWLVALARGELPISVRGGDLVVHSSASDLHATATFIGLAIYLVALPALATLLTSVKEAEARAVRKTLQMQSWQLRQLVPRTQSAGPSGGWTFKPAGPSEPSRVVISPAVAPPPSAAPPNGGAV